MIGFIRGTLVRHQPPLLLVDVNGVGYEVEAPMSTCFNLPATGTLVALHTHLVIREDQHILFGFLTEPERRLFRELLRINGVGPRLALGVLSGIGVDDFIRCVELGDAAALTRLPGIGRKTAERIIIDLRDRLGGAAMGPGQADGPMASPGDARSEALDALLALGYKAPEARRMLDRAPEEARSTEDLLRAVLRQAVPRG
ncbi:MAG: Holliday junction branch migration protein RuvA [Chromatiales bacterium]|nr:Holliday junction branch migration protein RuvA [Chromatiales bacterium]